MSRYVRFFADFFLFLICVLACTVSPQSVFAVSSGFTIGTNIGADTTPPSIPASLVATPIAPTQINLTWASSTDDMLLSGYYVWRGGVHIATTTLPFYADVGLTADTLYSYYVTAFDSSFNISASSSVVNATTLALSDPVRGTLLPLSALIRSLTVVPEQTSAHIQFETIPYTRTIIAWGRTPSYELGSLTETTYTTDHDARIEGLTPSTQYYFSISGATSNGRNGVLHTGTFVTLPVNDTFPPDNVTDLNAVHEGDGVRLSWNNPDNIDFAYVRVMRSNLFFPTDVVDGWVVYEGSGAGVYDRDAFLEGERAYYTVFTYDALGNISSGVVTLIDERDAANATSIIDPTKNILDVTLHDYLFTQDGIPQEVEDGSVHIDGSKQLTISIPYDRLPRHLKTIIVNIRESAHSSKSFSFLLRVNSDKTFFTGTIAPFGVTGAFPIRIAIFDFKTLQVGYVEGVLESTVPFFLEDEKREAEAGTLFLLLIILLCIGGIAALRYLSRHVTIRRKSAQP